MNELQYSSDIPYKEAAKNMYHIRVHFRGLVGQLVVLRTTEKTHWESLRCIWSIIKQQGLCSDLPLVLYSSLFHGNHLTSCQCWSFNAKNWMVMSGKKWALQSHRLRSNMAHLWMGKISSLEAHLCLGKIIPLPRTWKSLWSSISIIFWIGGHQPSPRPYGNSCCQLHLPRHNGLIV